MPKEKDLKRVVRARMQKTGESYTTARAQTLRKKAEPPPDYAALSKVSERALMKQTGRTWADWVALLDTFGAKDKPHRDIAAYVESLGVSGWWSQSVTVGYERIRGLRGVGQRRGGAWEANKSRTFAVPVATLFDAFANARKRARWLTGVKATVRSSTNERSMRLALDDGTTLVCWFTPKGDTKTIVALQHEKLPDKAAVDRMKAFWSERLDALGELVR